MREPKRGAETNSTVEDETLRMRESLRTWIRRSGKSYQEVAQALGIKPGVLTVTLQGGRPLRVSETLAIIFAVGGSPRRFFQELYGDRPDAISAEVPS